ncbi:hypothetical protein [Cryobacterium sp. PH31-O1]|uniref:hypothetical protein n=1 Tax=Cryobacterium sp. PH31-O1 TaxID=3046306 RepID=UPI0024B9B736|nr:hypothetical protein [Cryobacterium sp. PH31-O1]MDJ0336660.1 hypothetical protein [Cryobacterium sp. PH31-O1]
MLQNLNPPTICLILLGMAQLMPFTLLTDRLRAFAEGPLIGRVVDALGAAIFATTMLVAALFFAGPAQPPI